MERYPAAAVAFFAIWGQVERACLVESLRQELRRSLPLSCTIPDALKTNAEFVIFLEAVLSNSDIFSSFVKEARRGGRLISKTFLHYHSCIFKVLSSLSRKNLVKELT